MSYAFGERLTIGVINAVVRQVLRWESNLEWLPFVR
jgi:hypothetical protein